MKVLELRLVSGFPVWRIWVQHHACRNLVNLMDFHGYNVISSQKLEGCDWNWKLLIWCLLQHKDLKLKWLRNPCLRWLFCWCWFSLTAWFKCWLWCPASLLFNSLAGFFPAVINGGGHNVTKISSTASQVLVHQKTALQLTSERVLY